MFAGMCENCKRRVVQDTLHPMSLIIVNSSTIPARRKKFQSFDVKRCTDTHTSRPYCLCHQCRNYLVSGDDNWSNIWHLFLKELLCGSHTPAFGEEYYFYQRYSAETLWRLIPESMRPWWINSFPGMCGLGRHNPFPPGQNPYENCTVSSPPSIFADKTADLNCF